MERLYAIINESKNSLYNMVISERDLKNVVERKEGWKETLTSIKELMEVTEVKYQYIGNGSTLIYWLLDIVVDYETYCLRCNVTEYNQYTGNEEQYACMHRPMVPYE